MLDSLIHLPLFQGFEKEQLELFASLFETYTCKAETVIFEQGDPAVFLYLILNGSVGIRYKPYDGPQIILTHLGSGDVFGWSAVVGSPHYTSGVVSETDLEAIRIRGSHLWDLCYRHPELGKIVLNRLARMVSSRWKHATAQVKSILNNGVEKANHSRRKKKEEKAMSASPVTAKELQLRDLLERLSAYIEQFHGGSVDFVSFDGKILKVKLGGACLGCPLQPATLHGWVAGTVRQFFPDVEVVEEK